MNGKVSCDTSHINTIWLRKPEQIIIKMLNQSISKWKKSANRSHMQVKQRKII